jgi:membrane protein DedA with SNARE-associated domain
MLPIITNRYKFFIRTIVVIILVFISAQFNIGHFMASGTVSTSLQTFRDQSSMAAVGLSFDQTFSWLRGVGYVVMFLAMVAEGPLVTAAAAFAARLGYFNIWIVFVLAILGDLAADVGYYLIGYFGRTSLIEKYGHRFGLSKERMERMERLLNTSPLKTLAVFKLIPGLAPPGLMMVGTTHLPIRKYTMTTTLIILPKVILFTVLGYYFGQAYNSIARYVQGGEYLIIAAIIATLIIYWGYDKISEILARRLETV